MRNNRVSLHSIPSVAPQGLPALRMTFIAACPLPDATWHLLVTSGAHAAAHLRHALRTIGKKYALGSACIGGGPCLAIVAEAVA
jgi:Thiolase, C-terminal domain